MPAVQFFERIAAGVNGTKKTKLRVAYLTCLERAVSSVAVRHKQWPTVGVRMEGLYRRACKWSKLDGLEGASSPLAAVLLLRSGAPPEELLVFVAKRAKALQSDQGIDVPLRTLLALLRGGTRELEFPTEPLQKGDHKRLSYARAPLLGHPNAPVALGMVLEALYGRNCCAQVLGGAATLDLATELLLQIAAHECVESASLCHCMCVYVCVVNVCVCVWLQSSA